MEWSNKLGAAALMAVAIFFFAMLGMTWGTPTAEGAMYIGRIHVDVVRFGMVGLPALSAAWLAIFAYRGKL